MSLRFRLGLLLLGSLTLLACPKGPEGGGDAGVQEQPTELQILTISDWHGQIDPLSVSTPTGNVDMGGAAVLSSYFKAERLRHPNTLTFTAGDAFGASLPLASFFNEKPAVEALNAMSITADTFGNHNFDKGVAHLQTMINQAQYKFVSTNIKNVSTALTGVITPFHIVEVGGLKVGIIGITNPDAPTLVFPGSFGAMEVMSMAESIAAAKTAAAQARAAGAQVLVALCHLGATFVDPAGNPSGPLLDFAAGVNEFNVIVGDHTDTRVAKFVNGAAVVENQSKGRTYAKILLKVWPKTGVIANSDVSFVDPLKSGVTADATVEAAMAPYRTQLSMQLDRGIGTTTDVFVRNGTIERTQEMPIGDLLADAIRNRYGTQLALINSGGIRQPLPSSYAPADKSLRRTASGYSDAGPPYDLVAGDPYAVLPFGNSVVTRTVTGNQLFAMLENGLSLAPASNGKFPQISGFKVIYDATQDAGTRVQSITLDDATVVGRDNTTYTLATVDFVNAGGDGYTMLVDGQGVTREPMAEVLMGAISDAGTISPALYTGRIVRVP